MDELTSFERDQVVAFFLQVMTQDQRRKLMFMMPLVYNRLVGRRIMRVENTRTGDFSYEK
jgi:hypothetical protein